MTLIIKDRVKETAAAPGSGAVTLGGAVTGFQTFLAAVGNGNTVYYTITDGGSKWETGLGTYASAGNTLTRTTVLASSNGGSAENFTSAVTIWGDVPAVMFTLPTYTVLTSASVSPYAPPANCRRLEITLIGPGAGGAGSKGGGNGSPAATDTIFNGYHAKLGSPTADAGTGGVGGTGGANGAGATIVLSVPGQNGQAGNAGNFLSANGGSPPFGLGAGGQGIYSGNGAPGTGFGGGGQGGSEAATSTLVGVGGGAGEGRLIYIDNPTGTYAFTVPAGGAGGAAGAGGHAGGAGAPGGIVIKEIYN